MMLSLMTRSLIGLSALFAFAFPSYAKDKDLVLEQFLRGTLHAEGQFRNSWTGQERGLKVVMRGTWDNAQRILNLDEDITYSDGEKGKVVWVFTKNEDGSYQAKRDSVAATVSKDQGAVILRYTASFGGVGLDFIDRLELTDEKTVLNTATVNFLGFIPVGSVTLTIHKNGH
ncbi:MAG: DUF3833 family protein [Alphaproteobacteria bacterium]